MKHYYLKIFRFRFAMGRGKFDAAQKILGRIPTASPHEGEINFQETERQLWQRYLDPMGNIHGLGWKDIFKVIFKAISIVSFFILAFFGTEYILKVTHEYKEAKANPWSLIQKDTKAYRLFKLNAGTSIQVNIQTPPLVKDNSIYLPVPISHKKGEDLIYISSSKFKRELTNLPPLFSIKTFHLKMGGKLNLLYDPASPASIYKWLEEKELKQLKSTLKQGSLFRITSAEAPLLSQPDLENKSGLTVPKRSIIQVPATQLYPHLTPGFLWIEVVHILGNDHDKQGWLAALSIDKMYINPTEKDDTFLPVINNLTLRDHPDPDAGDTKVLMRKIPKDSKITIIGFPTLEDIISFSELIIEVQFLHKKVEYKGWIKAGKIKDHFIEIIEETDESNEER